MLRGGFPVGESKDWHPDGQLATRVLMSENGLRQLEITEWDDKGNLTREWRAEHGRRGTGRADHRFLPGTPVDAHLRHGPTVRRLVHAM